MYPYDFTPLYDTNPSDYVFTTAYSHETVSMKYKSTAHAIIALDKALQDPNVQSNSSLYLAEIYREADEGVDFGGTSDDALQQNLWIVAGEPVRLDGDVVKVYWDYGDTWYNRYDCLKTYAYTDEDKNSIVEIGSFMCESHRNMDGRYDRNRGQDCNLYMNPQNFNLINDVYSQTDNFFNYSILDTDYYNLYKYAQMVSWSTAKSNASDVDPWTTVTLASTLEIDGTKGPITSIVADKDILYAF